MELDLLERCRVHDRTAFAGLTGLWAEPALRIAMLAGERRARTAAATAFARCWTELPSAHSERAFRPWFLQLVARAAAKDGDAPEALRAIVEARSDVHIERAADAAIAQQPSVVVPARFFTDAVEPLLAERPVAVARRIVTADVPTVWAVLADPNALAVWTSAEQIQLRPHGPLDVGTRVDARGRIADARRSRDRSVVVRAEREHTMGWTTASTLTPLPGTIEFRWTIALDPNEAGCEVAHRLLGVAFPPGLAGSVLRRAYEGLADTMLASMHRGIERLATLAEARARD